MAYFVIAWHRSLEKQCEMLFLWNSNIWHIFFAYLYYHWSSQNCTGRCKSIDDVPIRCQTLWFIHLTPNCSRLFWLVKIPGRNLAFLFIPSSIHIFRHWKIMTWVDSKFLLCSVKYKGRNSGKRFYWSQKFIK